MSLIITHFSDMENSPLSYRRRCSWCQGPDLTLIYATSKDVVSSFLWHRMLQRLHSWKSPLLQAERCSSQQTECLSAKVCGSREPWFSQTQNEPVCWLRRAFFFFPRWREMWTVSSTFQIDSWEHNGLFTRVSTSFKIILNQGFSFLSEEWKKNRRSSYKGALRRCRKDRGRPPLWLLTLMLDFISSMFLFAKWPCILVF